MRENVKLAGTIVDNSKRVAGGQQVRGDTAMVLVTTGEMADTAQHVL